MPVDAIAHVRRVTACAHLPVQVCLFVCVCVCALTLAGGWRAEGVPGASGQRIHPPNLCKRTCQNC